MKILFISLFLIAVFAQTGCGYSFKENGIYAVINSSEGEMIFRLFYDKTPVTVGNFVGLSEGTMEFADPKTQAKHKKPFYDGLIFHRIIKDFVIQGGCPMGNGMGGPGYSFIDEFDQSLVHDSAGILSMANSGPNTNGCQFFITLAPTPHLNNRHTVFGKIVYGEDVMKEISKVKTDSQDRPQDDVVIKSIKIVRIGDEAKNFNAAEAFAKNEEALKRLQETEAKVIAGVLAKLNVNTDKIITTNSGLKYFIKRPGSGSKPSPGNTISAHYSGYLIDGTKFDSSVDRGKPFETLIGVRRVIPGWDEAFLDMRKGEKRVLIIPYNLAYGERGRPPVIPPMATLIFDVELLGIRK